MTFNMQKARAIAEKCQSRDDSVDHDYWNAHAGMFLPAALDEIDGQARQIAYWQECYGDVVRRDMEEDGACRLALAAKDRQIATLKAALIEQIAQDKIAQMGRFGFVLDSTVCDPYGDARKQLAQEYPEIAWEKKK